jgi:hypothetical protein
MFGAGHVVDIPNPSLPNGSHGGPVHRALPLVRIGRIGYLPFAGPARGFGTLGDVKLGFDNAHNFSPLHAFKAVFNFVEKLFKLI